MKQLGFTKVYRLTKKTNTSGAHDEVGKGFRRMDVTGSGPEKAYQGMKLSSDSILPAVDLGELLPDSDLDWDLSARACPLFLPLPAGEHC